MARRTRVLVAFSSVLLILATVGACSSSESRPGSAADGNPRIPTIPPNTEGGTDASSDARTDSETGTDSGVCNDVPNTGLLVDRIGVVGDPPVAQGGTIVDGLYDLTGYSVYVGSAGVGGPTGITAKGSLRIAKARLDEITEYKGGGTTGSTTRRSSTYSATAATLAATELCPVVGGGSQRQFTATDPILTLTDLSTKEAFVYTKR